MSVASFCKITLPDTQQKQFRNVLRNESRRSWLGNQNEIWGIPRQSVERAGQTSSWCMEAPPHILEESKELLLMIPQHTFRGGSLVASKSQRHNNPTILSGVLTLWLIPVDVNYRNVSNRKKQKLTLNSFIWGFTWHDQGKESDCCLPPEMVLVLICSAFFKWHLVFLLYFSRLWTRWMGRSWTASWSTWAALKRKWNVRPNSSASLSRWSRIGWLGTRFVW